MKLLLRQAFGGVPVYGLPRFVAAQAVRWSLVLLVGVAVGVGVAAVFR